MSIGDYPTSAPRTSCKCRPLNSLETLDEVNNRSWWTEKIKDGSTCEFKTKKKKGWEQDRILKVDAQGQ